MPDTDLSPIAQALGRIPTGLFVVSTLADGRPLGFVASFVVQTGFEPPTLCVAIGKGRAHLEAVRAHGAFAVSVIDDASRGVMTPFFRKPAPGESPFDALQHAPAPSGSPVLPEALAWLDCRLAGEHATGDHVVVFGEVTAAELQRTGDPTIHLRRNGLGY
jgi:flavin reductase (DIM6/NTAB) family NADH-FMN oxidoreductase RutF